MRTSGVRNGVATSTVSWWTGKKNIFPGRDVERFNPQ
jgi:hypothetical protein